MSEPSLGVTQLAWWSEELSPQGAPRSAHPVVRQLYASGALRCISEERIKPLIYQALERLREERINDVEGLKSLCNSIGEARIRAELAVGSAHDETGDFIRGHCAGTGMVAILDSLFRAQIQARQVIPLELQARHQWSGERMDSDSGVSVLGSLRNLGGSWFEEQISAVKTLIGDHAEYRQSGRHVLAYVMSDSLRFERTATDGAISGPRENQRWRLGDLVRIWSACRRVA
jgi:hypothetical protein